MSSWTEKYSHRPNEDGTYDSICHACLRTVARGMSEARLVEAEKLHNCPGLRQDSLSESNKNSGRLGYPELSALYERDRDLS
jgi:hypothetical protein